MTRKPSNRRRDPSEGLRAVADALERHAAAIDRLRIAAYMPDREARIAEAERISRLTRGRRRLTAE